MQGFRIRATNLDKMYESSCSYAVTTYDSLASTKVFTAGITTEGVVKVVRVIAVPYVYFDQLCISAILFTMIITLCDRVAETLTSCSIVRKGWNTPYIFTCTRVFPRLLIKMDEN